MATGKGTAVFKPYTQSQPSLLPPSLDELIESNHPVRVVDSVIESLDLSSVYATYGGGGASSYDPSMLLKVVVYAYLRNIFSSRKMEEALKENIHFMWLSGQSRPDHNTLARFRSGRLRNSLREVFSQVVVLLSENGLVSLEEAYIDGTKIEANAGRYTFVWGKAIKTNKAKMVGRLNELLAFADEVEHAEAKTPPIEFEQINPQKLKETVASLNERLKAVEAPKAIRQGLRLANEEWPERLTRYERQEKILAGRGSYSKTDPDATFMRMKEDHMGNGQLKPGYNLQISTHNQFVTHYSVHPNPTDTLTLAPHLESTAEELGEHPKIVTADAGYGSRENYDFLEEKKVEAFVKYPHFHQDQRRKKNPFQTAYWPYDSETDTLTCPAGATLFRKGQTTWKSATGYRQPVAIYEASGCTGCPFKDQCFKAEGNRRVEVNHKLNEYRAKAHDLLTSEEGIARRKRRCCEVETVFGQLKQNKGFRRLLLKGKEKVQAELGLLLLAHNLAKVAA
jgi:transposase